MREWSNLGPEHYGKDLMGKAFRAEGGAFPCGSTSGENLGWQQLATGFVQALGNVDRHRIQWRDDARAYAMGVLGTASLIITAPIRVRLPSRHRDEPVEVGAS